MTKINRRGFFKLLGVGLAGILAEKIAKAIPAAAAPEPEVGVDWAKPGTDETVCAAFVHNTSPIAYWPLPPYDPNMYPFDDYHWPKQCTATIEEMLSANEASEWEALMQDAFTAPEGGYFEFPGLETIIRTGYQDDLTGYRCGSLDDWNYASVMEPVPIMYPHVVYPSAYWEWSANEEEIQEEETPQDQETQAVNKEQTQVEADWTNVGIAWGDDGTYVFDAEEVIKLSSEQPYAVNQMCIAKRGDDLVVYWDPPLQDPSDVEQATAWALRCVKEWEAAVPECKEVWSGVWHHVCGMNIQACSNGPHGPQLDILNGQAYVDALPINEYMLQYFPLGEYRPNIEQAVEIAKEIIERRAYSQEGQEI